MLIGIFPDLNCLSGGVYQYGLTMLHALHGLRSAGEDEFLIFANQDRSHPSVAALSRQGWTVKPVQPPSLPKRALASLGQAIGEESLRGATAWLRGQTRGVLGLGRERLPDPDNVRFRPEAGQWFRDCGAELMLYPSASPLCFETQLPFVVAIHDLQHRLQPEFPEISADGEWQRREYLFRNAARHATLILTDSEVGREDILNIYGEYGIEPSRVKVLPFLPAPYLGAATAEIGPTQVHAAYRLPERYFFYPAQFWPHKNHARIVRALKLIKEAHGVEVSVVFCGSRTEPIRERTFREVMSLAHELQIERQVRYLGYVPDADMAGLYMAAVALVMPTFFGPTNIPVLEAWALNCPVLTSDLRGIREQAGDAAVLVDPRSVEAIADALHRLWMDETLRCELIHRGQQRLASYSDADYSSRLREIIAEAKSLLGQEKGRVASRARSV
ncbi:MAG TPA: glycosyltransferase family 1 protein [Pyrinomonadaceae bacterium]|jgi:glycosyltransferase involved in cell wall biosynthesis